MLSASCEPAHPTDVVLQINVSARVEILWKYSAIAIYEYVYVSRGFRGYLGTEETGL